VDVSGAGSVLRAAMVAAMRADPVLAAALNGVFLGPAVRASPPFAEVAETLGTDWGTKDRRGREVRLAVLVRDATETPARLMELAEAVEQAVLAMPRMLDGWQVASLVFVRSRVAGEGPGRWLAAVEFRARVLATDS
jgi:hypothetical protein